MKVIILSDNRPGHYKQSLGIVQKLPECQMEWLEIHFKQKWRDNVLRVFMCVFGGVSLPTPFVYKLLQWSLVPESYTALVHLQTADIVLSTGSSVAAVNLLLGRILRAKTVTCRRPSPIGTRYFDLAILPMISWHNAKSKRNICKTIGVPNPISPDTLNAERKQLQRKLNLPDCQRIGILIGGTDRHETITTADALKLSEICEAIAQEMNVQILVTTSRRTPIDVVAGLSATVKHADWCPLFVTPDTSSELADPYQAILALSDLLIVTADSFSMVCEAASSGHPVIVLMLSEERAKLPKRHEVYRYMEECGTVRRCRLNSLAKYLADALTPSIPPSLLQDTERAARAIQGLMADK